MQELSYERDARYIDETLRRLDALQREHGQQLSVLRENIEKKVQKDVAEFWARMRKEAARIDELEKNEAIREGAEDLDHSKKEGGRKRLAFTLGTLVAISELIHYAIVPLLLHVPAHLLHR